MENIEKMLNVPDGLINSIKSGNCVAFIGAGFSVPAKLPTWAELLRKILDKVEHEKLLKIGQPSELLDFLRTKISAAYATGNSEIYDLVAQLLEDNLGVEVVERLVRNELATAKHAIPTAMQERLKLLDSIPFKAIITTNFDMLLMGPTPWTHSDGQPPYEKILRACNDTSKTRYSLDKFVQAQLNRDREAAKSLNLSIDGGDGQSNSTEADNVNGDFVKTPSYLTHSNEKPIIKLHGTIDSNECLDMNRALVWTRAGYRKLLHQTPGYALFLKSIMATSTVLYLGFSFSDYYLNDVRSEVLSMLYGDITKRDSTIAPIGYAIANDKSIYEIDLFKKHEGVEIITWESASLGFGVFDKYLATIHNLTSYSYHLGTLLRGKRLLLVEWRSPTLQPGGVRVVDGSVPSDYFVPVVAQAIDHTAALSGEEIAAEDIITHAGDASEAGVLLQEVSDGKREPFDVIITTFGEDKSKAKGGQHTWKVIVDRMRELSPRAQTPFIVYSSTYNSVNRKNYCIRYGAFDFVTSFSQLVHTITTLFKDSYLSTTTPISTPTSRKLAENDAITRHVYI